MLSHYEVLGVARNATPEEIKKAWRKESSKAHPDRKGGDNERQQAVNKAHDVLSDPERRERYDKTGKDDIPESKEKELENMFMQFVNEVIDALIQAPYANPVSLMHKLIDASEERVLKMVEGFKERDKVLQDQIKRIRRRKNDKKANLFLMVMESQRAICKEKLETLPPLLDKIRAIRPMANEYEFISQSANPGQFAPSIGGRSLFTNFFGGST